MKTILTIARQEFVVNARNKWTTIFAIVFAALVVGISYVGTIVEGFSGVQNFTRTSTSILNLVLYIVPLVALTMGTLSFTGDKGSMELLFSQPVSRSTVLTGKLFGVFGSIVVSTTIGFALAGAIIVSTTGTDGLLPYAVFVLLALALAFTFLSLSVLVATVNRRKSKAFGMSLFLWFFFVLFYDLLAIGGTVFLKGQTANTVLFLSLFGNPVDMVRVASLIMLDNVTIFGASGAALLRFFGGGTTSVMFLIAGSAIWAILPWAFAQRLIRYQDV